MKLNYDKQLLDALIHLQKHNCYLPFIGEKYGELDTRILIVAESHYLPTELNNKISVLDWYLDSQKVYELMEAAKNEIRLKKNKELDPKSWINTRGVIKHYLKTKTATGGLSIFYKLEQAFKEVYKNKSLFEYCLYINYFQRPAEKKVILFIFISKIVKQHF